MALPELRSPFARAVVPVAAGMVVIVALAGMLWLMAVYATRNGDQASTRLAPDEWTVGDVNSLAALIDTDGPLLFQRPGDPASSSSIVVYHTGDDPTDQWRVYAAHPADRSATCEVELIKATTTLRDCDDRIVDVTDLADPALGVVPRVDDNRTLVIDFRAAEQSTSTVSG